MAGSVPWFVWPIVLGLALALVVFGAIALRRRGAAFSARAAAVLSAWLVLVVLLSAAGAFGSGAGSPPRIELGFLPPILAGGLALALSRSVRARALAIPPSWLVGIQSLRAVGFVFLVLLARGALPPQFALPAGWGDVTVGLAAPAVAWALARGKPWAPRLAVAWNALGLLDLAVATGMGALSAGSAIRLLSRPPTTDLMAQLPLSLIPAFGVPIFVLLHLASLVGLRAARRSGERSRERARPSGAAPAAAR